MEINLETYLTPEQHEICYIESRLRVGEQIEDIKKGLVSAMNSNGIRGVLDTRDDATRYKQGHIGSYGECVSSLAAKTTWTREKGQYKGNNNPDLWAIYKGRRVKCACRGTEHLHSFIYRFHEDDPQPDTILIVVTNLPHGPICKVGHARLGDIKKIVDANPHWETSHNGARMAWVPFRFLSGDFSEFGA